MKNLLKLEELGQFLLSIMLFSRLEYSWWIFPMCLLLPDLSMIGYLISPKIGAWMYNFFHHKLDRKSTRLNSSHVRISYAVFCLKKKKHDNSTDPPIAMIVRPVQLCKAHV